MEPLTDKNFIIYAAKNYLNPTCSGTEEFMEDMKRVKYIKKLLTRYIETGELKERLILNHIIVLGNVFKPEVLCRILFLKMENQFEYIKPFLVGIGMLTKTINDVKEIRIVNTDTIGMNQGIINGLRKIYD